VIDVIFGIKLNAYQLFCIELPEFLICTSIPYFIPGIKPELLPTWQTICVALLDVIGHE
jgi:hypothetical protein